MKIGATPRTKLAQASSRGATVAVGCLPCIDGAGGAGAEGGHAENAGDPCFPATRTLAKSTSSSAPCHAISEFTVVGA
jgi:hypothetical protein